MGGFAEGAVGYQQHPAQLNGVGRHPQQQHQNVEAADYENIYETIEINPHRMAASAACNNEPIYERMPAGSARSQGGAYSTYGGTYGRIGNTYGRIDIIGHGIGRIERHLSSSCGSGIDTHHYATLPHPHKVSVQWLLVNKWLPLWTADGGRDYRIVDYLLEQQVEAQAPPRNYVVVPQFPPQGAEMYGVPPPPPMPPLPPQMQPLHQRPLQPQVFANSVAQHLNNGEQPFHQIEQPPSNPPANQQANDESEM